MTQTPTIRMLIHQFIIDQSGSMLPQRSQVIALYNQLTQEIQKELKAQNNTSDLQHLISLCVFDGTEIKHRFFNRPIAQLEKLTENDYQPKSNTPLYDAIGSTIAMQEAFWEGAELSEYDVLVTILTDGCENSSRNYSPEQIHQLVKEKQDQNWTFTYMGAHEQVAEEIRNLSMSADNASSFTKDAKGFDELSRKELYARKQFMEEWSQRMDMRKKSLLY